MLSGKTGDRRIGLKETPSEAQTLIDCWGEKWGQERKGKQNSTETLAITWGMGQWWSTEWGQVREPRESAKWGGSVCWTLRDSGRN